MFRPSTTYGQLSRPNQPPDGSNLYLVGGITAPGVPLW